MLTYTGSDEATRADLVHQVLDHGLDRVLATGAVAASDDATNAMVDPADRMTCEYDLILASGLFEEFGYVWHYPENAWAFCGHREGLRHFVRYGWRMLLNPTPDFDLWWYWYTYLDPEAELVNPFVHFLAEGRHRRSRHGARRAADARRRPRRRRPGGRRRVCLFAGFDVDGIVDDTVVAYVRELSRFADVYYLADCVLEAGELDEARAVHQRPLGDPARPLRLRLLLDAGARPGGLGHDRDVRRAAPRQRQLLPRCSPWTRCSTRMDARPGALVGAAGHRRRLHPRAS